ncbi:Bcr/CflA family drug resistance efflux transporter, partial [Francisella tularensis subsp. holarctica]|nr:Bcr/CflA family drug resistance efflux transporter [Francisella tularensis subsp. holarctica]
MKVTAHKQRKLIIKGYYFVIIITKINNIISYIFDNIYIFIFLNDLLTIWLAFVNITTTSKVIDLLIEGFAAGFAVIGLVKFTVAG